MILTPLLSLDYSSFSLSNVKNTFQKENDREDEEKLLDEKSDSVKIKSAASGNVATASTKEYIIGCVAAEMPATYSTEALKAQAVCAYTNLVRLKKNPDSSLSGADISDDPGRHQGYYDTETQKEKWGDKYDEYRAKTEEAVNDVLGKTIVFNGEPIVAAYCAISPGRTESAENIWGGKIEYLVSVTSPGDKLSPDCIKEISLSADEVREYTKKRPRNSLGRRPKRLDNRYSLHGQRLGRSEKPEGRRQELYRKLLQSTFFAEKSGVYARAKGRCVFL